MNARSAILAGLAVVLAVSCGGAASPALTAGPTPTAAPTGAPTIEPAMTVPQLKLALVDAYGPLWYCDPDFYPIQRADEMDSARERWPEVVADTEAFAAVTAHLGLDPSGAFTDEQKLAAYRLWKMLNAILLDPIGNDTYRFDYLGQPFGGAASGIRTAGTITADGRLFAEQAAEAGEPICPICLAAGVRIDTPDGPTAVESLRIGDPVWTLDAAGLRTRGAVLAVGSTSVPAGHRVVRLVLTDGRTVTASPGHPLGDGRRLGDIEAGDSVDGSVVISADLVAYHGGRTYDILVSGRSGVYLVDGIAVGSTLRP